MFIDPIEEKIKLYENEQLSLKELQEQINDLPNINPFIFDELFDRNKDLALIVSEMYYNKLQTYSNFHENVLHTIICSCFMNGLNNENINKGLNKYHQEKALELFKTLFDKEMSRKDLIELYDFLDNVSRYDYIQPIIEDLWKELIPLNGKVYFPIRMLLFSKDIESFIPFEFLKDISLDRFQQCMLFMRDVPEKEIEKVTNTIESFRKIMQYNDWSLVDLLEGNIIESLYTDSLFCNLVLKDL